MDNAENNISIKNQRFDHDRATDLSQCTIDRELYSLIGGAPPVAFVKPTFHSKYSTKEKAEPWTVRSFTHPARTDGLVLRHWEKKSNAENDEYAFAKFNKTIDVIEYTDEEYEQHLQDPDWTKEETDQLFQLCRQFDLRFHVIDDRYQAGVTPRTIEDLKDRYYSINRTLLWARAVSTGGELTQERQAVIQQHAYDKTKEIKRKQVLEALYNRTQEQVEEEEALFVEARRIQQNESRLTRERESLLASLHLEPAQQTPSAPSTPLTPSSAGPGGPGSIGITGGTASSADMKKKRKGGHDESNTMKKARRISEVDPLLVKKEKLLPGVHVRSEKFLPKIKTKMLLKVHKVMSDLGIGQRPVMPTEQVCLKYGRLQNSVLHLLELKEKTDFGRDTHGRKNSSSGASGSREKRRK